jgi:hypothetical protein
MLIRTTALSKEGREFHHFPVEEASEDRKNYSNPEKKLRKQDPNSHCLELGRKPDLG